MAFLALLAAPFVWNGVLIVLFAWALTRACSTSTERLEVPRHVKVPLLVGLVFSPFVALMRLPRPLLRGTTCRCPGRARSTIRR